jgi:hypothetical protein
MVERTFLDRIAVLVVKKKPKDKSDEACLASFRFLRVI